MGEKKGNTIKLVYDFNTSRCCEIEYKPNTWARVTCRDFRSFKGNRRILNVDDPTNTFYEDYNGPVYLFGTNEIINPSKNGMQYKDEIDPRNQYSKPGRGRI